MVEKQKEEAQKSYPGASSSSSRGAAAVMATVETEETASLAGDATLPFTAITLPRSRIQVILIALLGEAGGQLTDVKLVPVCS